MPSAYQELTLWATKMQAWRTGARGCETNFGQLHRCAHRRASLQRSMQHSRAGTGAEPTQQHPTPLGPGAAPRSSSWGGADRQPIGVGLSQCHWKPKTSSHRRSTDTEDLQIHRRWPHEELPAATQPHISDCTQRSAQPAQRVTELPGLLHPIPPPHPRSVIGAIHGQLRRCPRTAPRGAQQRPRTAPHRTAVRRPAPPLRARGAAAERGSPAAERRNRALPKL